MARDYYKQADLLKAIERYDAPQSGGDLKASMLARVRIGGSATALNARMEGKSPAAKRYTLEAFEKALLETTDPHRRLLLHNVLMRIDFSYGRFLSAARDLSIAPLSLAERYASWHLLYVHRFTSMSCLMQNQWVKSGYLLRKQYNALVLEAKATHAALMPAASKGPVAAGDGLHYLIVTTEFLKETHPITKQAIDLGDALVQHQGARVSIINAAMPPRLPIGYFSDHTQAPYVEAFNTVQSITYGSNTFAFSQDVNMIPNAASFQWYAALLDRLKPDGVISIGPGNMLVDCFKDHVPTLAFPNLGEVPFAAAAVQCTIKALSVAEERLTKRANTPHSAVKVIPTAFQLPASVGPTDRNAFGFPSDARIALIVGLRLQTECSPAFLSILSRAAQKHPDLHFVFVGPLNQSRAWLTSYPALQAKSKLVGFSQDVLSITQACDLFINPFRQGGGTSAVFAISQALPVITLKGGDVAEIFGQEESADDEDGFETLLDGCLSNGDIAQRLSDQAIKRWTVKSDMAAMSGSIAALLSDINLGKPGDVQRAA